MNQFELVAEPRSGTGKGYSRRLRREGKLPAVVYGGHKAVSLIEIDHNKIIHQLENEAFYSHILTLKVGNDQEKVVLKDMQRSPYGHKILHVDLQRIDESEKLVMHVPLHFLHEDSCVGVKQGGGIVSHVMNELEVTCLPKDLPEYIEVDLQGLDVGDSIHLGDLQLGEGVELRALLQGADSSQPIVTIHIPKIVSDDQVDEESDIAEDETTDSGDTEE